MAKKETLRERQNRLRRGVFVPGRAGVGPGRYYNQSRIAGRVPQSAGNVGPDYNERIAAMNVDNNYDRIYRQFPQGADHGKVNSAMQQIRDSRNDQWMMEQARSAERRMRAFRASPGAPPQPGELRSELHMPPVGDQQVEPNVQGPPPAGQPLTPQEQVQKWADANTTANAEIVPPGGSPQGILPISMFGGGSHLDTPFWTLGPDGVSKTERQDYKILRQGVDTRLRTALASRSTDFHSVEEAQQFVDSLGFDDRTGEYVERTLTKHIQQSNPKLYAKIIGNQSATQANDNSYTRWIKQTVDNPAMAHLSDKDILAMRTPESQLAFENDPNAEQMRFNPATEQIEQLPPRRLSPVEESRNKLAVEEQIIDEQIQQDPNLMKTYRMGKPEVVSKQEYFEEQRIKRTGQLENRLKNHEKAMDRDREAAEEDRLTKNELLNRNAFHVKSIDKIYNELNDLEDAGLAENAGEPIAPAEAGSEAVPPVEAAVPVMTPEEVSKAPAGTQFKTQDGRVGTANGPVAPEQALAMAPPAPVAEPPVSAPPAVAPAAPATVDRRAELLAKAPAFDESDVLKFVGEGVKSGVLKVADLMKATGEKGVEVAKAAGKQGAETYAELIKLPLSVAAWEVHLGETAWNKLMIGMEDKLREEWVNEQLKKESGQ